MADSDLLRGVLDLINETLTTTIVILAASILLYNLSRRTHDRVTRAASIVLACVVVSYTADVFVSLDPGGNKYVESYLRLQWIGIAYIPAALFHLSDALLATTGRPSRGRRRFVIRISYLISTVFMVLALFTDYVVTDPVLGEMARMRPAAGFAVYAAFLLVVGAVALVNVARARRRCLTRYTRRRMTYLLSVFLTPVYGTFPYSLLFGRLGDERATLLLIILNVANLVIMLMLVFMAYPLSFFGAQEPDRVVKSRLMEFMLRGPLTGAAILAAILFIPRATNFLGMDGDAFMPFAAVAILLFLQWSITLALPVLKRWLVYTEDQFQARTIERLGDRLLTQADASQLIESVLAAICDYLRVPTAFVAEVDSGGAKLVQMVGSLAPSPEALVSSDLPTLLNGGTNEAADIEQAGEMFIWHSYWLLPLRSASGVDNGAESPPLGVLGVWARAPQPDLDKEELAAFSALAARLARVLEDMQRQAQVFLILEGLATQMDRMQALHGVSRYGYLSGEPAPYPSSDLLAQEAFSDLVKDALRDYWGGPKLTDSELLKLNIVWREMTEANESSPVRALRAVLARAIENLKPEGQRSLTTTEWVLYNILEMRFLQGRKVRDVALRLAMSESDLYRKQRIAIEEVARQIADMERDLLAESANGATPSTPERRPDSASQAEVGQPPAPPSR
ncbi:MAG: hypothetical protein GX613_16685 [Chloroflexi bacterium]|nr:hypothetical protein [Chloroflexota bacterium]